MREPDQHASTPGEGLTRPSAHRTPPSPPSSSPSPSGRGHHLGSHRGHAQGEGEALIHPRPPDRPAAVRRGAAAAAAAAALARGRLAASTRAAAARLADAAAARLDAAVAAGPAALRLAPRFFEQGWGDLTVVDLGGDALLQAAAAAGAVPAAASALPSPTTTIPRSDPAAWFGPAAAAIPRLSPAWTRVRAHPATPLGTALYEATFPTPAGGRVFDALPPESRTARAWLLVPEGAGRGSDGCVVHLAGTGDHGPARRLALAAPLADARWTARRAAAPHHHHPRRPIAAVILESPFYGSRRPPGQAGAKLGRVSDLLALGRATVEEALALLAWAAGGSGADFSRLGVAGLSMGGVHAGMVAGLAPGPLACAPLLAPRSAAAAFCDGALWPATAWRPLTSPADGARRDVLQTVLAAAAGGGAARAAESVLAAVAAGAWPLGRAGDGEEGGVDGASVAAAAAAAGAAAAVSGATAGGLSTAAAAAAGAAAADAAAGGRAGGPDAADGALAGLRLDAARPAARRDRAAARTALAHVLETYTDVTRLPPPALPGAAVVVGATADAYVARASVAELAAHWPGSEVRWVRGGHVSAYLTQGEAFRAAIRDAVDRVPPFLPEMMESVDGSR